MIKSILMIAGPSAAGKSTLLNALVKVWPDHFCKVRSLTTRPKRSPDDDEHSFVDERTLQLMIRTGQLAEYDEHNGYHYGVAWSMIHEAWAESKVPIMALNLAGVNSWIDNARQGKFEWRLIYVVTKPNVLVDRLADRLIETGEQTGLLPKQDVIRLLEAIKRQGEFEPSQFQAMNKDDRPIVTQSKAEERSQVFLSTFWPIEHIDDAAGSIGVELVEDLALTALD